MSDNAPILGIVIAPTRPGRVGPAVAGWFTGVAEAAWGAVRTLDLADFALPLFDEPHHPRTGIYLQEHTRRWSAAIAGLDAVVFVTPEYNGFPPPSLINAIDYLHGEWSDLPAGIVSYGSTKGGVRAATALRQLAGNIGMSPVAATVSLPGSAARVSDGRYQPDHGQNDAAKALLAELAQAIEHRSDGAAA